MLAELPIHIVNRWPYAPCPIFIPILPYRKIPRDDDGDEEQFLEVENIPQIHTGRLCGDVYVCLIRNHVTRAVRSSNEAKV